MVTLTSSLLWVLLALTPTGAVDDTTALDHALDTVDVEDLSADLHFIASDEMGGRDTPSAGLQLASMFIRNRLQRLGWQPGYKDGSYFFPYELERTGLDVDGTTVVVQDANGQEHTLRFGADFFFNGRFVSESETTGGVVFCGRGDKSDFEAANVEDKWALCVESELNSRALLVNARQVGAAGIIVVPDPASDAEPYGVRYASWVEQAKRGRVSWPRNEDEEGGERGRRGGRRRGGSSMFYVAADAAQRYFGVGSDQELKLGADLGVTVTERRAVSSGERVELHNVCGFWPGSDPDLKNDVMIVSAHYDHVGIDGDGNVFNGADDNGSGTTGLLAIAEALAAYGPMKRSVMLIWVSGEEKGLLGSRAWSENPWLPEGCEAVCDLNIDMIGRNADNEILITPTKDRPEYNGIVKMAEEFGPLEGFDTFKSADAYWNRSDHANFAKLGMPVAFLFSDVHEDYHKVTDTPDKINYGKMRRVVRLVVRMLDALQSMEKIGE
ncbi:MAG: M28 family peptidase [Planctomycetota bacterium]